MTGYLDLEQQPIVVRTAFPAEIVALPVEVEDRRRHQAKVVLTREAVYVWTMPGEPLFCALRNGDALLRGTFDPATTVNVVPTLDGEVSWRSAPGCGCSHPLKRWRPWSGAARLG